MAVVASDVLLVPLHRLTTQLGLPQQHWLSVVEAHGALVMPAFAYDIYHQMYVLMAVQWSRIKSASSSETAQEVAVMACRYGQNTLPL